MHPNGFFPAKGAQDVHMQGEGRQPLHGADNMGDVHQVVIHHRAQMVGWQTIRFEQHGIIQG